MANLVVKLARYYIGHQLKTFPMQDKDHRLQHAEEGTEQQPDTIGNTPKNNTILGPPTNAEPQSGQGNTDPTDKISREGESGEDKVGETEKVSNPGTHNPQGEADSEVPDNGKPDAGAKEKVKEGDPENHKQENDGSDAQEDAGDSESPTQGSDRTKAGDTEASEDPMEDIDRSKAGDTEASDDPMEEIDQSNAEDAEDSDNEKRHYIPLLD